MLLSSVVSYTGIATFARYLFMLALLHWRVGSLYNGIAMLVTQTRGSKEPENTHLVFILTFKSNRSEHILNKIKFKFSLITAKIFLFSSLRKEIYICHKGCYLGLI